MFPVLNVFGLFPIPMYGTVFGIGFAIAVLIARKIGPLYGIGRDDITFASIYGILGLLVGAKVLYFLTKLPAIIMHFDIYLRALREDPLNAISYAFSGLVFYGGLFGAILGVYCYCRQYKVPFTPYLDIYAPLLPFVHGFGRIGCFLAGCCYGIEYHGFGSVQFPYNELVPELNKVPRVPVQLIEAALNFILCAVLFFLMKKKKMRAGQLLGIYFVYYAIVRYLLEKLRGDIIRGGVGQFSTSQIISMLLLPVGIVLIGGKWLEARRAKKARQAKEL